MRIKKLLSILFLFAWVAGEAPRLWWGAAWTVRPMDLAASILFLADIISNKKYKSYKSIGLVIAAAILGPYALRTLVYGWLIWRSRNIFSPVRKWITPALAAFLVLGLGQYLFLPDMRFLLRYGWDEHYYRLVGTVLDPNYFGVMAGMIGLYFIDKWINGQMDKWKIRLLVILSFAVLVLTWSRASWVAVCVGLWVGFGPGTTLTCSRGLRPRVARARVRGSGVPADFSDEKSGYVRRRLGILGILGILGVIVWWAAPKPGGEGVNLLRTASIEQRLAGWREAIGVWKQYPWFGVGFNQYGSDLPSNSFLVILQTTGLAGAIGTVIGGMKIIKGIKGDRFWLAIAAMVGIHAVFNNTLFYPPVLGLLALLRIRSLR